MKICFIELTVILVMSPLISRLGYQWAQWVRKESARRLSELRPLSISLLGLLIALVIIGLPTLWIPKDSGWRDCMLVHIFLCLGIFILGSRGRYIFWRRFAEDLTENIDNRAMERALRRKDNEKRKR